MIKYNYHTHTSRCGHAIGEDEDYVLEAITMGLQELGFSDHIMLPGFSQPGVRGDYSLLDSYLESIADLKKKYRERIKIYCGFEAEACPQYFSYYRDLLDSKKVDYLILGNHCTIEDGVVKYFFSKVTSKADIIRYGKVCVEGMKTGLFSCVAHPDYFMAGYHKWDHTCSKVARLICKTALELDMPLEFNLAAIRRGMQVIGKEYRYLYPHLKFWEIVKKHNVKVIIGIDAHSPADMNNYRNDEGYRLVKELGLNVIQKILIKE